MPRGLKPAAATWIILTFMGWKPDTFVAFGWKPVVHVGWKPDVLVKLCLGLGEALK